MSGIDESQTIVEDESVEVKSLWIRHRFSRGNSSVRSVSFDVDANENGYPRSGKPFVISFPCYISRSFTCSPFTILHSCLPSRRNMHSHATHQNVKISKKKEKASHDLIRRLILMTTIISMSLSFKKSWSLATQFAQLVGRGASVWNGCWVCMIEVICGFILPWILLVMCANFVTRVSKDKRFKWNERF